MQSMSDEELNTPVILIDDTVALKTDIREKMVAFLFYMRQYLQNGR